MFVFAEQVVEELFVDGETRLILHPLLECRLSDGEHFGIQERGCRHDLTVESLRLAVHRGGFLVGGVDREGKTRVDVGAVHARHQSLDGLEGGEQGRGVFQRAFELFDLGQGGEDRVHFGRPGFGRGEDGLGVPGVGLVEGGAEGEGGCVYVVFPDQDFEATFSVAEIPRAGNCLLKVNLFTV